MDSTQAPDWFESNWDSAGENSDQYDLNDIGLAMRVHQPDIA